MPAIFISYRRDDSAFESTVLCEVLQKSFGRRSVFMDVDGIPLGVEFGPHIVNTIRRSEVCLAVISSSWLDATTTDNRRRLDDPQDFVRQELEISQQAGLSIVPVLIGKADLPLPRDLPETLRFLPALQAIRVRPGGDLQKDLATLCERVREIGRLRSLDRESQDQGRLDRWKAQIRHAWWHPLVDSLWALSYLTVMVILLGGIGHPLIDQQSLVVKAVCAVLFLSILFIAGSVLTAGLALYCALYDLAYCGAIGLLRRVWPWRYVPILLIGTAMLLSVIAVFMWPRTAGIRFPAMLMGPWVAALAAQLWFERHALESGREVSVQRALVQKALSAIVGSGMLTILLLIEFWRHGMLQVVPGQSHYFTFALGALLQSSSSSIYCTAAQIVRGALRWRDSLGRTERGVMPEKS